MALIRCKYCDKDISDKAKNCPHCGGELIEEAQGSEQSLEIPAMCEECGTYIPRDSMECPNCGCPLSEKAIGEDAAQKVEVTAVNLQIKKSTKKYAVIAVVAVVLIAVIAMIVSGVSKRKAIAQYSVNLEVVSNEMLQGAAKAENACNLIRDVWRNSIYEERDSETDKYTLDIYGDFYEDFNDALNNLFSDTDFLVDIYYIEYASQESVAELMKELKSPPEEYEDAYEAVKECYDAYLKLTNLAIDPQGSLQTFSSSFNAADSEMATCYNALEMYINN